MRYTTLPKTDIKVSKICLGTMTWGNQNTQDEGFAQMDMALDKGVNFFDVAELYPVPATADTYAETERIIGNWFEKTGNRDKVVLATKIAGPGDYTAHIRTTGFSKSALNEAVDASLKRLKTDYIDLYQLHWPERQTNTFGVRDYNHNPNDPWTDNFNEILHNLDEIMKSGKIRHVGISNEKAWGTMRYLEESKTNALPRMITIQNAYSLLNRVFEGDMAEISLREDIGLLAYSPMAFGVLSGKYIKGTAADNARLKLFPRFARYSGDKATEATKRYMRIAEDHNMTLAQMSLAFVTDRPFMTSNIIGATSLAQLEENIDSINFELSDEILKTIDAVHAELPNPAP
ncbi:aldo/keto reductase [Psychroserpens sp.]|uniref:aldo/keto reductase n=1 Tax=Psychroserpens sp. TaxID=2020870 RepID=UPI001B2EA56C|nr:aldo/keto reductase [Psychroserpens sp.]MBO6605589.1 aldo/keto reductase [Psychroserpens sp.]MBO6630048.1 aldo/keto reductase [Psychroserpens sp.]MBO6653602.1 aldo/keto reductase [Psychroserpens sp.]MBO6681923.1 aldo/keto reductase [Psychroserpens sp.]MBO6748963.1 aldo/keto reductase [Psychroserpens sp.]